MRRQDSRVSGAQAELGSSAAETRAERFALLRGTPPPPRRDRARRIVAGAIALGVLGVVIAAPLPLLAQVLLAVAGLAPLVWTLATRRPAGEPSGAYLQADGRGLTRVNASGASDLVSWEAPFGVSLLASYGRPTGLLAFTTATQTRYVPARIDERSDLDDELLARIAVLADLDLVDGVAHEAALTSASTAALVRRIERHDKHALGRIFLSDGRGLPIALDRATLAVGERSFDLTSQLEWRPLMFHESTGHAAALYQATWIKQAGAEVVLVAPMPASIVPREPTAQRDAHGRLGRTLTRDLRLLQAPAETPPARDVRVAIDRPFMMAVRRVLDDAPLAARVVPEPPAPRAKLSAHS
ncbi:MAG: hypothetical protein JWP97_4011 [Labilithrix sp.]|nr:hypothetical protein [Labilithrix sp.]